jgi:hypothetical protein
MSTISIRLLSRRVQPSYALPTVWAKHLGCIKVSKVETPGNGLLVDAALGMFELLNGQLFEVWAGRFNQYVPVPTQSLRATN